MTEYVNVRADEYEQRSEGFWTVVEQRADAGLLAVSLKQEVFEVAEPAFAHLRTDPAEYTGTLARLIGLMWVTGLSTDEILSEEQSRLEGKKPSPAFQEACEKVAAEFEKY